MRTLVFVLILANLLFLAWTQGYFGAPADPDAQRVSQQLLAERVRIVARNEAEALKLGKPARIAEKKPAADVCLLLADLSIIETERLEARLTEKLPVFAPSAWPSRAAPATGSSSRRWPADPKPRPRPPN